jgi:hypothetical protein
MIFFEIRLGDGRLGGRAFCFVSPERFALSSLTYPKRSATQTPSKVFYV